MSSLPKIRREKTPDLDERQVLKTAQAQQVSDPVRSRGLREVHVARDRAFAQSSSLGGGSTARKITTGRDAPLIASAISGATITPSLPHNPPVSAGRMERSHTRSVRARVPFDSLSAISRRW